MEISRDTIVIFYTARVFGLAPYKIKKNGISNFKVERSKMFCVYSLFLISIMVCLTYRGLLFDADSNMPVRAFKAKSNTSKIVTGLDVSVVVLSTISGVACGINGFISTQNLNKIIHEADEFLTGYNAHFKDQTRAFLMLGISMFSISLMLGLDVYNWNSKAKQMNLSSDAGANIIWYVPFYSLYFILGALHVHFANSGFVLASRYKRLNLLLKTEYLNTEKAIKQIDRIAYFHESLGKGIHNISSAFGVSIVFLLVSCLLHLVATAYFLFLELIAKPPKFSYFQFLWICLHWIRLLLIVEPCHIATTEAKKTIQIVCEIDRNCNNPVLASSLKKFWQQLLADKPYFTAYGMCNIDRQILTSFSSAICTYLVILIQFQGANG